MSTESPNDLLTRQEVADMLKISVSTVQNLYMAGHIASHRVGRHVRITRQAVWDYLNGVKRETPKWTAEQDVSTWPPTPSLLQDGEDK